MTANRIYKKSIFFARIIILLALPCFLASQSFEETGFSFPGAGRGDMSWCDYDNDHDLDVLITGRGNGDQRITALYRNDEGIFNDSGESFIAVEESMVAWGDYDQDGDQDLLIAGNAEQGDMTILYRNDGGSFSEMEAFLPAIQQGTVLWVDIDGDNDLDIFLSGSWITRIYLNEDGVFVEDEQDFGYFSGTSAAFGDYDNDGDLDLLINGDSGAGAKTFVFTNSDGTFIDSGIAFNGLMAGTTDWIDYDLDGDLDAAISGNNDALEAKFYLYKNQDKQFELVYSGIDGFALGDADWGDFDNDGDPDLLMSGKATGCGAVVSGIYRNDGNGSFYKLSQEITTAMRCTLEWADFDNDGDLDFLISGNNYNEVPFTMLYRNVAGANTFAVNSLPAAPDGIVTELDGDSAILSWAAATDDQTPGTGLTYNVRLGTTPGGNELAPSMADAGSGYRFITAPGNAGQNRSLTIENLEPGTYFWSVQSIDQAMEGSAFSDEQSFTINTTGIDNSSNSPGNFIVYPNPVRDQLYIRFEENTVPKQIIINDLSGKIVISFSTDRSYVKLNTHNLKPGAYFINVESDNLIFSQQFLKIL
jgi:hypothetical protein